MSLLRIEDLTIHFPTEEGDVRAVNGVSLSVEAGQTLGLVGETGAGKTTTALGILRLVPEPGQVESGSIIYKDRDIMTMSEKEVQDIRGNEISMIFQDPMTALNPVMTVGDQVAEVILRHQNCTKVEAQQRMIDILGKVGIGPDRASDYPHQFSGGMKQRVVIAIALACNPKLLILITHDLGIVAESCDQVAIMYAGEIVEYGSLEDIFDHTTHPYTKGLFNSIPSLDKDTERLQPIQGLMPDPANLPEGCKFHPRCPYAVEACAQQHPGMTELTPGHLCRCLRCGDPILSQEGVHHE